MPHGVAHHIVCFLNHLRGESVAFGAQHDGQLRLGKGGEVSKKLLQYSVVGLGFGMNLHASLASGKEGMMFTIVSVVGTMVMGMLIGRKLLKMNRDTSYLISSGTAICGGSAIVAVGPVIKAKDSDMSVALATIFVLNAIIRNWCRWL